MESLSKVGGCKPLSQISQSWGWESFSPNLTLRPSPVPANRRIAGSSRWYRQPVLACLLALAGLLLPAVEARTQDLAGDKAALEALYNATGGANWTNNTNWLSSEPVGDWHGVTVSNGRVTRLRLIRNGLAGTIPTQLGNLTNLQILYLQSNQLTGTIPTQLGNLVNLETLWLFGNQLTGTIPNQLANLTALGSLHLGYNQLTGSIPTWLGNLVNLGNLYLRNNQFTGTIPTQLANLTNLTLLSLESNRLTGSIPTWLGNLTNLQILHLESNQLTGTIPTQLGNLTNLKALYLSNNQLTGTVPTQLGNLVNLETLRLNNNQLTGSLPQSLTNLVNLDDFRFDNGTRGLCAPNDTTFQNWLETIPNKSGPTCSADNYSIPAKTTLTYPKAGSGLDDLIARVAAGEISATDAAAEAPLHRGDAVAVTIHLSGNVNGVVSFLQANGVTARNQGTDYIEAFVPVRLLGSASQQTGVLRMRMIQPPQENQIPNNVPGNGPPVHGSLAWNTAGYDGQGVRVGVIDGGFIGMRGLLGTELPAAVRARCYGYADDSSPTTNLADCETEDNHGTVVAESILDIAPNVELFISQPRTHRDLRDAVEWMALQGVDVINHSMGWFFDGPGDGTSSNSVSPLKTVDLAVNRGIVWVNSAGNGARTTWFKRGPFSPFVINFNGLDSTNSISLGRGRLIRAQLRWSDSWGGATRDLDLCIGDTATGEIVKCTNDTQTGGAGDIPFDAMLFVAPSTGQYDVVVVRRSGTEPAWIQLTMWNPTLEHSTANGSITNPGESNNPGVLTVGAAHWNSADTIESYSSQGPSPDGRTKPDVVGADCGETETLKTVNRAFCGTSQASPHVAGMAALVRQRFPQATPAQVAAYLKDNAEQRVPSPDPNNTWGHGFAVLPQLSPHAISCASAVPDSANNPDLVRDCETLLSSRDQLQGSASLNWGGDVPITLWEGISLGGSPQRVTQLAPSRSQLTLTGSIPAQLGNLANLERLTLSYHQLTGTIPNELANLDNLVRLDLTSNQLTGTIPAELGNLDKLQYLLLRNNQLTGTIPNELGRLNNLGWLGLHDNQLTGTIPNELANLNNLYWVMLGNNQLTGAIPAWLGNLINLQRLFLDNNQLTGVIPAQLGNLLELRMLFLNSNQLTGSIPAQLGSFANLERLRLHDNQLTGTLPQSFTDLGALEFFLFYLNPGLCAQDDNAIQNWLNGVGDVQGPDCSPAVRLSVNPSHLWEGAGATPVTVTAQRAAVSSDTLVNLRVGGSAEANQDYTLSGALRLTIPANSTSGSTMLTVTSLADMLAEDDENLILEAVVGSKTEGQAILGLVDGARACAARDRMALEVLYNATGGPNWANDTNWLSDRPLSEWHGVTADNNGCVTGLDLRNNQLAGSIPPELGNLASLEELSLWDNQLTGAIPSELGRLNNLGQLILSNNQLTGNIPAELGNLTNLTLLILRNNQLTGAIPSELGNLASLEWLYLAVNQLTGVIPPELGNLASLEVLYLYNNQLTGAIPSELGRLNNLGQLILSNNQLTGTIPPSFTGLGALQRFDFYLNPGLCAQSSSAIRTWLNGVNEVQGPDCTPSVRLSATPSHLWEGAAAIPVTVTAERAAVSSDTLVNLRVGGSAGANQDYTLRGALRFTIPANTTSGTTLLTFTPLDDGLAEEDENIILEAVVGSKTEGQAILGLVDGARACAARDRVALEALQNASGGPNWTNNTNWLSDKPLSDWHGVTADNNGCVTGLDLRNNQLAGTIPRELGNLANLRWLDLHSNQLTGTIPAELGKLANLESLYLQNNQLTGVIPTQLGNLANLNSLSLNNNQLTGEIPAQLGNLADLRYLSLHNNQLMGTVPSAMGSLANLRSLWLYNNQLTGILPQSFTQLAALQEFFFDDNAGLCAQADPAIRTWLDSINDLRGPDCALSSIFVPVILTASGRSNSFFTSELALTNRGSQEATLRYTYTAAAGGGGGTASESLAPGRQKIVSNAIDYLRALGVPIPGTGNRIGTLRVEVSGSEVGATVRTTTRVADGRAGLAYPGIAVADGFEEAVYLCGLRQNRQDRSNVAFQNMGTSQEGSITLRTTVYSGDPDARGSHVMADVTLAPGGFHQYSGLLATAGMEQGYVKVERVSGTAPFYAYGVINDQANSDGSFVFPVTASSQAGARGLTLPVIIEHPNFRTELILTNFSNSTKWFDFHFVADAIGTPDNTASSYDDEFPPGVQSILPNFVQEMRDFGAEGIGPRGRTIAGAAFFEASRGDLSGVVIGARTGSPGGGGQYSVFYNAVPYGAAFDREAWIDALQQNRENRSNLALVNTGEADSSDSVFELEIYNGDTGRLVNTVTGIRVPPRGWRQINGILGNYAPGTTQGYVRVRKTAGNNPFLAYGVVNDGGAPGQRSGDGAYLPAQP